MACESPDEALVIPCASTSRLSSTADKTPIECAHDYHNDSFHDRSNTVLVLFSRMAFQSRYGCYTSMFVCIIGMIGSRLSATRGSTQLAKFVDPGAFEEMLVLGFSIDDILWRLDIWSWFCC